MLTIEELKEMTEKIAKSWHNFFLMTRNSDFLL